MSKEKIGLFKAVSAAVIIDDENRVLLSQRSLKRDHHPGAWEILSGRLDQNEDFEQAIEREALEELNVNLEIIAVLSTFHFYRGEERDEHVGIAFLARIIGGTVIVDGEEEINCTWFSFPEAIQKVEDESIRTSIIKAQEYLQRS